MTKKHFIAFAAAILRMGDRNSARAAAQVVINVARSDNPRFDTDRFLRACGLE